MKARQCKAGKPGQGRAREGKTKQGKARQNKQINKQTNKDNKRKC